MLLVHLGGVDIFVYGTGALLAGGVFLFARRMSRAFRRSQHENEQVVTRLQQMCVGAQVRGRDGKPSRSADPLRETKLRMLATRGATDGERRAAEARLARISREFDPVA